MLLLQSIPLSATGAFCVSVLSLGFVTSHIYVLCMHWGYDPPSATPHIQLVSMESPKAKEEFQSNSFGYSLCPFFARTNWNKHSSLQLSTSAECSAQVEPAYVSGKADNNAVCSSTSFCACTSKFCAKYQWPYSLLYLAPWLWLFDFSLRYKWISSSDASIPPCLYCYLF